MFGMPLRVGFSMKIDGVHLNRPDMHNIAAELGLIIKDRILTVYNTSDTCQEIIDDNALLQFVAMILHISSENISELKAVKEEPVKIEFDLSEFEDDD
ncbi:MAG: hypothetical protein U9O64_05445 [Campylobacterota bacterium]|nr:hypothetical protein [Campylobacterota bacterium]